MNLRVLYIFSVYNRLECIWLFAILLDTFSILYEKEEKTQWGKIQRGHLLHQHLYGAYLIGLCRVLCHNGGESEL